jgi:hypothetical protein
MRSIFLSYHTPDRPLAEALAQALQNEDNQLQIFLAPWALRPGSYWISELGHAIQQADALELPPFNRTGGGG